MGAEERLFALEYQVGQFVPAGPGEDQAQAIGGAAAVEMISRCLEGEHCVHPTFAVEGVLGFVDDQHDHLPRDLMQHVQGVAERGAGGQLRLGEIPAQGAQQADLFDTGFLGRLAHRAFELAQGFADGAGDQLGGVDFAVHPEVHVNRQPASGLAFGDEVVAQESTFARATGCREEHAGAVIGK